MHLGNTVEFAHMTLCLVPKVLNAIDVILLVFKSFRLVDTEMLKIRYRQHVVAMFLIHFIFQGCSFLRHRSAADQGCAGQYFLPPNCERHTIAGG